MNRLAVQSVLDAAVAGGIPGVAAAVTDARGTMFAGTAGVTMLGGAEPVTAQTLFWVASMTKPITWVAAMQLVERGRLALDAPVETWLPELADAKILQDGRLRPATEKITLRHLLTHTSGFSYGFASAAYAAYIAAQNIPMTPGARASLNLPLLFEPGERWEYGISTDLVGLAVEAASGERLDDYFARHIFEPLGMTATTFVPGMASRAAMHQRLPDGRLIAIAPSPAKLPEFYSGGGGLYSTLDDYQKFMWVFLTDGAGVIRPETVAEMARNQIGDLRAGYLPSTNPAMAMAADVNPGMESKWGLGFLVFPEPGPFGRRAGSLSWAGLPNTYFWIDPKINLAAVILMQFLPAGDAAAIKTYSGFEAAVYAAPQ